MGLDMYAYSMTPLKERPKIEVMEQFLKEGNIEIEPEQIAQWRKHNALHAWMEDLYTARGGTDEFNCVDLPLTNENIDDLELAVKGDELQGIEGFFFGGADYDDDTKKYYLGIDLKFIDDARSELKKGNIVYYSSWW